MPKLESTRYTVLFATAVSVVCALLVATAAVGLRARQEANALIYKQKNVLLAAGLAKPGEALSAAQVQYAALDALVLIPLRERLERDAIENGWTAEVHAATERSMSEALRFA